MRRLASVAVGDGNDRSKASTADGEQLKLCVRDALGRETADCRRCLSTGGNAEVEAEEGMEDMVGVMEQADCQGTQVGALALTSTSRTS